MLRCLFGQRRFRVIGLEMRNDAEICQAEAGPDGLSIIAGRQNIWFVDDLDPFEGGPGDDRPGTEPAIGQRVAGQQFR